MSRRKEQYWHGSPFLISLGDWVLPGDKVGKDRYRMNRTSTVYVASDVTVANSLGTWNLRDPEFMREAPTQLGMLAVPARGAKYLYLVEPHYLFALNNRRVPRHICQTERQCRKALVVERFECVDTHAQLAHDLRWTRVDEPEPHIRFSLSDLEKRRYVRCQTS